MGREQASGEYLTAVRGLSTATPYSERNKRKYEGLGMHEYVDENKGVATGLRARRIFDRPNGSISLLPEPIAWHRTSNNSDHLSLTE